MISPPDLLPDTFSLPVLSAQETCVGYDAQNIYIFNQLTQLNNLPYLAVSARFLFYSEPEYTIHKIY